MNAPAPQIAPDSPKLAVVMVGLPARGKSYTARRIERYLSWLGYRTGVFNVGEYRRARVGAQMPHSFFNPDNPQGEETRRSVAMVALEDMVTAQRDAAGGRSAAFARGEAIGRVVGAAIVTRARGDGFGNPFTGTIPVGPGFWTSNTTPPTVGGGQMPGVLPWFMTSASQFRPAPPPAFGSADYVAALAEIRRISDTRTAEQIEIATFWAMNAAAVNPGEPTPPGFWIQVATDGINQHAFSEREATHLYALLGATMFDAAIGCWDGKLTYWLIRPWQADPAITIVPAVGKPNHPSYPSAHSSFSSSAAEVLSAFFPNQREQLEAMVTEAGLSRMYGGIHYRFDIEAGRQLGQSVARFAIAADRSGHSVLTPDDEEEGDGPR